MKSYHHHSCDDDPAWVDKAKSFSAKVFDFSEFLDRNDINLPFRPLPWTVTYHDPCHLAHGQQIREAPRRLLQKIPGIQYVELDESDWCCGSAGVYNILQQEIADQILARKMTNIARTGAQVVVTANPGCLVQLYYGLQKFGIPARLLHLAEVLKEALMGRQ
ncbi:MAG: (Fe-S)-binding protein [Armatimonadota bacterium]|nr:(Fe-S)-binding protein [Armatimonadota bacterium]